MNKWGKIIGIAAFLVALGAAIMVTKFAQSRFHASPSPTPIVPVSVPPPVVNTNASPVHYRVQQSSIDFASNRSYIRLLVERAASEETATQPERLWVWTYYFTPDAPGRSWSSAPVEIANPLANRAGGRSATVTVTGECPLCDAAARRTRATYYARTHVTSEPPERARPDEALRSFDINTATQVLVQGRR